MFRSTLSAFYCIVRFFFIALSVFFIALSVFFIALYVESTESGSREKYRPGDNASCCCVVIGYFPIVMAISSPLNLIDNTKLHSL